MSLALAFSGNRGGMTAPQKMSVEALLKRAIKVGYDTARHGMCRGCDEDFDLLAMSLGFFRDGWPALNVAEFYKADIPDLDRLRLADFPIRRNQRFINRSRLLIACPRTQREEQRSGTWASIRFARKILIPVYLVHPNGFVQEERRTGGLILSPLI